MAEAFGAGLLAEVESCGLDELLHDLRQHHARRHGVFTGIALLDRHLAPPQSPSLETNTEIHAFETDPLYQANYQAPFESAAIATTEEAIQRHRPDYVRPSDDRPDNLPAAQPSIPRLPVLEIVGATPCSGKTRLLYQIAAEALLASRDSQTHLADSPSAARNTVVWIDAEGRFDGAGMYRVLIALAKQYQQQHDQGEQTVAEDLEPLAAARAETALRFLHVFRPTSSDELLRVLDGLEDYLLDRADGPPGATVLRAIILSNRSAFYWQDQRDAMVARVIGANDISIKNTANSDFLQRERMLVTSIRRLQSFYACPVIVSDVVLTGTHFSRGHRPQVKAHHGSAWNSLITARMIVARDVVSRFPRGMSVQEAQLESSARLRAVQSAAFTGWFETPGADNETDERTCAFRVHADGIEVL